MAFKPQSSTEASVALGNSTELITLRTTIAALAAAGVQALVAAQGAGTRIKLVWMDYVPLGTVKALFHIGSGTSATECIALNSFTTSASGNYFKPGLNLICADNAALNITNDAAGVLDIDLTFQYLVLDTS